MKTLVLFALVCILCGCATSQISKQSFMGDDALKQSATKLAKDYLNDQMQGGDDSQFGNAISFLNLHDWQIQEPEYLSDGDFAVTPAVICKLKTENRMGGIGWEYYVINFDYNPALRSQGDRYNGLRIKLVRHA